MPSRAQVREAKLKAHGQAVQRKYGIAQDVYWDLYKFQHGRCAICKIATGRTKRLSVDHDHSCQAGHDPKTGCPECVRGLLCGTCNVFVGRMRDNPEAFERGAAYLRDPPFQRLRSE